MIIKSPVTIILVTIRLEFEIIGGSKLFNFKLDLDNFFYLINIVDNLVS